MKTDEMAMSRNWLSEGLLIAALPIVSYGVAFAYEAGFASVFEIPIEFIDISLTNTIIALLSLLLAAMIFFGWIMILDPIWIRFPQPVRSRLIIYIPSLFIYITGLISFGNQMSPFLKIAFTFVVIMVLIDFIHPLLMSRDKRSYLEKLDHSFKVDLSRDSILDKIITIKTVHGIALFFLVIAILWLSFCIGRTTATNSTTYYILGEKDKAVVLRKYGDIIIAARINELTKEVLREYFIYKISADKMLTMRVEKIGHLKLVPEKTP